MTTEEAIKTLNEQKNKLKQSTLETYQNWIIQTIDYVKVIVGPNSALFSFFLVNLELPENPFKEISEVEFYDLRDKATHYVQNCIEYVHKNGVYKEPRSNFLRSVSNEILLPIIISIIPVIFYAGDYFRSLKIDQEKFNLVQENQILKNKLDSIHNTQPIRKNNLKKN